MADKREKTTDQMKQWKESRGYQVGGYLRSELLLRCTVSLGIFGWGVMKGSKSQNFTHNVGFFFRASANSREHEPPRAAKHRRLLAVSYNVVMSIFVVGSKPAKFDC